MKPKKAVIAGLMLTFATFFLALAIMDFSIMHMSWENYPEWLYKYWISLGLVVTAFAFALSYTIWVAGIPKPYAYATFLTVWLLFIAGLLDIFYFVLATLRGEQYSFAVWHWAYKLGYVSWGWNEQIAWTVLCIVTIAIIWDKTLKR